MENHEIQTVLMNALPLQEVHVSGDGSHFQVIAVGEMFDGMSQYMCNGGAGSATQITNFIDEKIFVLNPDGTLVNTIELDRRKMSNLYYGDDKYLFLGYSNKLSYIDKSSISGSVEIVPVK